jgi:endogenous inhibitor of DNA gyrase (YacG/DUF329 family)
MRSVPCPICHAPVAWETTPTRPFCSERCRTRDLGAWSAESYRIAGAPESEEGEGWSEDAGEPEPR